MVQFPDLEKMPIPGQYLVVLAHTLPAKSSIHPILLKIGLTKRGSKEETAGRGNGETHSIKASPHKRDIKFLNLLVR
jgi:hypothetical protein